MQLHVKLYSCLLVCFKAFYVHFCTVTMQTSATHVNNNPKTMVQLVWTAPAMDTGTVLFRQLYINIITTFYNGSIKLCIDRYAFVDAYTVYWSNQATDTVNEGNNIIITCIFSPIASQLYAIAIVYPLKVR